MFKLQALKAFSRMDERGLLLNLSESKTLRYSLYSLASALPLIDSE